MFFKEGALPQTTHVHTIWQKMGPLNLVPFSFSSSIFFFSKLRFTSDFVFKAASLQQSNLKEVLPGDSLQTSLPRLYAATDKTRRSQMSQERQLRLSSGRNYKTHSINSGREHQARRPNRSQTIKTGIMKP